MRFGIAALLLFARALEAQSGFACGIRTGEVRSSSAIVWLRTTGGERKADGSVPGKSALVRLRYAAAGGAAQFTRWKRTSAAADYTARFILSGLTPDTRYEARAETQPASESPAASFKTAPLANADAGVRFAVLTGLMYQHLDSPQGFHIFEALRRLKPDFIVLTGDNVYYDNEPPKARTVELMRYHWQRMYSLPRHVAFFLETPAYWMKDDHDVLRDDIWPAMSPTGMEPVTYIEGARIFLEQTPAPADPARSVRWGKNLQIWLPEGRDFRSPNNTPDGPAKTIWGEKQKRWLFESMEKSGATWRVLVSPTPIVGPDRGRKADNHANAAFATEGNEVRRRLAAMARGTLFVACGDRHWQYHSVHPETGIEEFSCGPASDEHASGSPGEDPVYHRFHRVKGGFLMVAATRREIVFRHHDVRGAVVYETRRAAPR
jgi:alkaline phosphatase D